MTHYTALAGMHLLPDYFGAPPCLSMPQADKATQCLDPRNTSLLPFCLLAETIVEYLYISTILLRRSSNVLKYQELCSRKTRQ